MVADIRLLQGKLIENPEQGSKNISKLIEEFALEVWNEEKSNRDASPESSSRGEA